MEMQGELERYNDNLIALSLSHTIIVSPSARSHFKYTINPIVKSSVTLSQKINRKSIDVE